MWKLDTDGNALVVMDVVTVEDSLEFTYLIHVVCVEVSGFELILMEDSEQAFLSAGAVLAQLLKFEHPDGPFSVNRVSTSKKICQHVFTYLYLFYFI